MYYIGIDIGGTKCAASLGFSEGGDLKILRREEFKTEGKPESVLDRFADLCHRFTTEHGKENFGGIGISVRKAWREYRRLRGACPCGAGGR